MIGITIMMVMIAAVLPLASTQSQREKEEELIFRGRQYAEGVRTFRRKYGRYPTTLKEMFETRPRTLRKLWKDPVTNANDWSLITMGSLTPIGPPGGGGSTSGGTSFGGSFGSGSGGGKGPTPTPAPTPEPFGGSGTSGGKGFGAGGTSGGTGFGKGPDQPPLLPVMGVRSSSRKKAFRVYQGRDTYFDWQFTEATLALTGSGANDTPGGLPGPGVGGGSSPGKK